jgi:hypothetical protein
MQSWIEFVDPQVVLNKGLLFMSMEPAIASLGLTPDLAEIPIPTYFLEEGTACFVACKNAHL